MSCRRTRRRLVAYLDDELGPSQVAEVEEHLDGCRACAERLDALAATTPIAPVVHLDPAARHAMHQRLEAALAEAARQPAPAPRAPWAEGLLEALRGEISLPRGLVIAYAAALLVAVGVAAGRGLGPEADRRVAERDTDAGPSAALEVHRPAAYTPTDGWF